MCVAARHYSVIGKQLQFANIRNRVRGAVLCLSQDGACTNLLENFSENCLKGYLSNDTTLNPPLFSLVNTFKGSCFFICVNLNGLRTFQGYSSQHNNILCSGEILLFLNNFLGDFFEFFSYCIQHCFICRPSDSTVPLDAGIEPRTVATDALAVRRPNHQARSHPHQARSHPQQARSHSEKF